jgi:predicted phage tail protein
MSIEVLDGGGGTDNWHGGTGSGGSPTNGTTYTDAVTPETGTVQVLLSEGEIAGLANSYAGLKSIYLDNTPVMNSDGSMNFKGLAVALVSGTNTQSAVKGNSQELSGEVSSETTVNVQVSNAAPVTRSITSNPSAVRVRISIPSLKVIDRTSGNSSGNRTPYTLQPPGHLRV